MPAPDPFDELEELFAEDDMTPVRTPTRREAQVTPAIQRTPTRAEALPNRTPTRLERPNDDAVPFRPSRRPPMALLCICDDGSDNGEWIRIRHDHFVLGKTEGDVQIGHDDLMAPRHAEITRTIENGKWHWHLTDLHSATGTFVSVTERPLKNGSEMWLGGQRYRFELEHADQLPTLRALANAATCYVFDGPTVVLGRQPTATAGSIRVDDPQVHSQHVRFERRGQNWHVVHLGGKNGLWVRVDRVRFPVMCRFQLGEQRFLVRVVA